ncbi:MULTISPECIES: DUF1570 domain-containing protein [Shewanella]|uniref:DUF1570 domain-containing protein n=1 Tax=Shewanella TaxID=22 RepID=UPI00201B19F6|nr:DUF1570 domain-containing protein [Shewanella sp. 10B]
MESRTKRIFVTLFSMAIIALLVDYFHYQGRWSRIEASQLVTNIMEPIHHYCLANQWDWCTTSKELPSNMGQTIPQIVENESHQMEYGGCDTLVIKQAEEAQQSRGIYTWVDEKGQTHFSDSSHAMKDSQLTHYTEPQYSFELKIDSLATTPPPFFRDRHSATIKDIDSIYRKYLPKRQLHPIKVNLMLAGNLSAYNKLKARYASQVGASQGFYSGQHNLAAVWHREDSQAFRTAIHESVHVMNAGQFGDTPRWLNEGLAEYFESSEFLETVELNTRYESIINNNTRNKSNMVFVDDEAHLSMGLVELLASEQDWQGQKQDVLYQHSHSFVRFLFHHKNGKQLLRKLFEHLSVQRCGTKNVDEILGSYPGGINQLNRDWLGWRQR